MAALLTTDYTKLTVPQLKALCKERKISGYSKLSKPALIQKLVDFDGPLASGAVVLHLESTAESQTSRQLTDDLDTKSAAAAPGISAPATPAFALGHVSTASHPPPHIPDTTSVAPSNAGIASDNTVSTSDSRFVAQVPLPTASSTWFSARPSKTIDTQTTVAKKPIAVAAVKKRTEHACGTPLAKRAKTKEPVAALKPPTFRPNNTTQETPLSKSAHRIPQFPRISAVVKHPPTVVAPQIKPPKRFKPLVKGHRPDEPRLNLDVTPAHSISSSVAKDPLSLPSNCFEFPSLYFDSHLKPISLPPPISQRKHVQGWAIILSGLDGESRKACSLASRTFRYAVYLSAAPILHRMFSGKRLETDIGQYSQAMTNLWPYLRFREEEALRNRRIYEQSFLYRLGKDGKANGISPRLWGSPDNPKQITVAVRFALSSLWFALSIGGRESEDWLLGTIVKAQELVEGDVWIVTVQNLNGNSDMREEAFYVLEQTCEVIGRLDSPSSNPTFPPGLRADWYSYLQARSPAATQCSDTGDSLLRHLKWAHQEEYEGGISKLWLKRLANEGRLGKAKLAVAERYVLACVMANSVSGKWMSTAQMAQEFASLPDIQAPSMRDLGKHRMPVNLYLPAPHHVESIHFSTASKVSLHPALAVIQTPSREYFVLRDNGMQVGNEEEGVAALWMEVIGCDNRGLVV